LESIKTKLREELTNNGIKATLNIVGINDKLENYDDDLGTANSLFLLKDKLIHDCMIVSCDLISNVNIQLMANFYRANDASFMMLLANTIDQPPELSVPGSKGKYSPGFFL
jgi:NDP-sugar pyrophosphorylase family protein